MPSCRAGQGGRGPPLGAISTARGPPRRHKKRVPLEQSSDDLFWHKGFITPFGRGRSAPPPDRCAQPPPVGAGAHAPRQRPEAGASRGRRVPRPARPEAGAPRGRHRARARERETTWTCCWPPPDPPRARSPPDDALFAPSRLERGERRGGARAATQRARARRPPHPSAHAKARLALAPPSPRPLLLIRTPSRSRPARARAGRRGRTPSRRARADRTPSSTMAGAPTPLSLPPSKHSALASSYPRCTLARSLGARRRAPPAARDAGAGRARRRAGRRARCAKAGGWRRGACAPTCSSGTSLLATRAGTAGARIAAPPR